MSTEILEPNWESCWEISGIRDSSKFFRAIPVLLPASTVLYFEGTSISKTIKVFLQTHAVPTSYQLTKGTIWPKSATFHVPISPVFIEGLATLADHHAEPEICDHIQAYCGSKILLMWFDAFYKPLYVTTEISEADVKTFCKTLGAEYKSISKAG